MENPKAQSYRTIRLFLRTLKQLITLLAASQMFFGLEPGLGAAYKISLSILFYYSSPWAQAFVFAAVLLSVYMFFIELPFAIAGYITDHRFGQSNQTMDEWFADYFKGTILGTVLGSVGLSALLLCFFHLKSFWWLGFSAFLFVFGALLTRLAPQLIIPLFFKLKPIENQQLVERLKIIGEKVNASILGIFEMNLSKKTNAANAAVVGFGATRKAIVGDTLLKNFSEDEILFVLTHELGHHHHNDLLYGLLLSTATNLFTYFLVHLMLVKMTTITAVPFPIDSSATEAFHPVLLFWTTIFSGLIGFVLSPLLLWYSRTIERRADRFAVEASGLRTAGASSFEKLGQQNLAVLNPPFWEVIFYYSHPPLGERIRTLNGRN